MQVDPAPGGYNSYKYSLFVDGKPFEQFQHYQAKALRIWETSVGDNNYRIVLGDTSVLCATTVAIVIKSDIKYIHLHIYIYDMISSFFAHDFFVLQKRTH